MIVLPVSDPPSWDDTKGPTDIEVRHRGKLGETLASGFLSQILGSNILRKT